MKVVAIIQARMGSTRLPGKVLKDIGGKTMLARVVRRAQRAALVDQVVVAATVTPADEAIVAECRDLKVPCFRGSEADVLDRYYQAARTHQADLIVRITSDCPLIDPEVTDQVVRAFLDKRPDFASNCHERSYPQGLDVEVTSMPILNRVWHETKVSYHRVHVMPYIYQNPDRFQLCAVKTATDYSHHRWTVDTPEDLEFVRAIYARFGDEDTFGWREVLTLLAGNPELIEINQHVRQKKIEEG